jgi:hypothetical protein
MAAMKTVKYYTWASNIHDAQQSIAAAKQHAPQHIFEIRERPCFSHAAPTGRRIKDRVRTGEVFEIWETLPSEL